jgi:hypothetical protein
MVLAPHPSPERPYEVVLTYSDGEKRMREVYRIDPQMWVMVEGDVFEDGMRVDHVAFSEIRLDAGVPDSVFRL